MKEERNDLTRRRIHNVFYVNWMKAATHETCYLPGIVFSEFHRCHTVHEIPCC
jgi:hypothetical protein